jgi:hypothetical protein
VQARIRGGAGGVGSGSGSGGVFIINFFGAIRCLYDVYFRFVVIFVQLFMI